METGQPTWHVSFRSEHPLRATQQSQQQLKPGGRTLTAHRPGPLTVQTWPMARTRALRTGRKDSVPPNNQAAFHPAPPHTCALAHI
eukprot:364414-Chlamydomonas_euryale.AAC.2